MRILIAEDDQVLADGLLRDVIRQVEVFGFHFARLDIRQHADLQPWVAHARELCQPLETEAQIDLLGWVARFDHERASYALAQAGYERELAASQRILGAEHPNTLTSMNNLASTLKAAAATPLGGTFPATSLGAQLKTTAQLIAAHARLGAGRQVYHVTLGGFDTHSNQAWQHGDRLAQLSAAVDAFQSALTTAGLDRSVTLFTASEFGRTLSPNATGTDHGWGSTSLVVGGAVQGGLYGEFPDFTLGGPDDATGRGVWIPRIGFQQLGATLGRWFGVSAAALSTQVFPAELDQFARKDLGFMG